MPTYRYKAMSADGRVLRGKLEAPSLQQVIAELKHQKQFPISAELDNRKSFLSFKERRSGTANDKLLSAFFFALSSLLEAGMPVARALELLVNLREFRQIRTAIATVSDAVRKGSSLADALQQDTAFSGFVVAMIRAGEAGGTLTQTVSLLANYLERSSATRQAITSALLYPAFLGVTAVLSIGVIMIFVIPSFAPLFEGAQKTLPTGAAILLALSDFLTAYWSIALIVAGLAWLGFVSVRRRPGVSRWLDTQLLRMPFLGTLVSQIETERFCRVLSALLSNAVALPTALDLTRGVLGSPSFREIAIEAAAKVREGRPLSTSLEQSQFPDGTIDFLRIGEESGNMAAALLRQADLLASRTRMSIDRGLTIAVPTITIGLGVVVGAIIATLLTAILSVNELAL